MHTSFFEIQSRGRCSRVYAIFMGLFAVLLIVGRGDAVARRFVRDNRVSLCSAIAVLVRSGIVPFHLWMPDLFEKATFGASLLFCTPLFGALVRAVVSYGVARRVVHHRCFPRSRRCTRRARRSCKPMRVTILLLLALEPCLAGRGGFGSGCSYRGDRRALAGLPVRSFRFVGSD